MAMTNDLMADSVNSIGLALDILGVALVFFYALPPKGPTKNKGLALLTPGSVSTLDDLNRRYNRSWLLSRVGFICLVAGFGLQIASNFL